MERPAAHLLKERKKITMTDRDTLKRIEERADDLAGLLRGLEGTAEIVATLGSTHDAPPIGTHMVAHMMSSFRETLSTVRDALHEISEIAGEAACLSTKEVATAK